jgi:hypothetical protein
VHFEALPAVAVDSVSVGDVTAESAELEARIDPVGTDTEYHFEYIAAGETEWHETPSIDVGSGSTDVPVSAHIQGLKTNTVYAYRVIAKNVLGEASAQAELMTQRAGAPFALLDGRSWEQVSPPDKGVANITLQDRGGAPLQSSPDGRALTYLTGGYSESEPEGETLVDQVVSRHGASGWSSKDIETSNGQRQNLKVGESGEYWLFSEDLGRSIVEPSPYTPLSEWTTERTPYLRDEAKCAAPQAPGSECFLPLVTNKGPFADVEESVKFGGRLGDQIGLVTFVGGTPDLSHLVLVTHGAELSENAGPFALYEWSAGKLTLLSVTPSEAACKGTFVPGLGVPGGEGNLGLNARNALSPDGALVVWGSPQGSGVCEGHLYLRDVPKEMTAQLDEVEHGVSNPGVPAAEYQDASVGDEHIFFTDSQRLTADSTGGAQGESNEEADLYEYDHVTNTLTDLTVPVNAGEAAAVQGVLGASEDGSYVYFVADGVLSSNENTHKEAAKPGDCELSHEEAAGKSANTVCNLYVAHYNGSAWESPMFIASLSGMDEKDWKGGDGGAARPQVAGQTSRVSPDGKWLAFMSQRSLTGYDNEDVTSVKPGERMDEEAFLYDASSGGTVCASCDPTGARPAGLLVNPQNTGPNPQPLIDRENTWEKRWLSGALPVRYAIGIVGELALHQPRYLSDGGRLFFDSTDALVPTDKNGVVDAYEYEPPTNGEIAGSDNCSTASDTYSQSAEGCIGLVSSGTSTEESVFIEASENGDSAFFLTSERLAKSDTDTAYDVYDAHVCGSGWQCEEAAAVSPPCTGTESCRAAPSPQPSIYGAPSSATFSGAGNVTPALSPPPPAKVVKKAVRCKQGFVKNRKGKCVRNVRKKKGARKARRATNDRRANR